LEDLEMDELRTSERGARAQDLTERLRERDVRAVAITFVDNAGIARVKGVPLGRLAHAFEAGIGMAPVFDVFLVNDDITSSEEIGGPAGDLRLYPDPSMLVALAGQPGWAWAPVDRRTQEGEPYVACQRTFARRQVERAAEQGLELRMAFEYEWMVGSDDDTGSFAAACQGPAYGMGRIVELSDYTADLLDALDRQGVRAEQLHPEYAAGQFELSIVASEPVAAADLNVLVRHTIRAVSLNHRIQASFAPAVVAGSVGNGGHLHFSVWREGRNLLASGTGPHGMTETGEAFLAGVLDALPALCAIGAPSVSSYLRLVPSRWAGAFQCWGRENREAAMRFVTGTVGRRGLAANAEVKSFDLSANPYLVVGAVIACGLDGVERRLRLPEELTGDPSAMSDEERTRLGVAPLPASLPEALDHLERSRILTAAMGSALHGAFRAVRQGEQALFGGRAPEDVAAATRWRY
jgi:glutamine synthetase